MRVLKITTALVFLLSAPIIFAQIEKSDDAPKSQKVVELVRRAGWEIPDVSSGKFLLQRTDFIEETPVVIKIYDFRQQEIPLKLESYFLSNNALLIAPHPLECELYNVTSFEAKEKIFAYKLSCVPIQITEGTATKRTSKRDRKIVTYSSKVRMGALIWFFYLDKDGDGKFETKYDTSKMPAIPAWLTQL